MGNRKATLPIDYPRKVTTHFTPEFRARHTGTWRLSDRGIEQTNTARDWFRNNELQHFDRYTVSSYTRACETAGLLELPEADWRIEYYLRKRE